MIEYTEQELTLLAGRLEAWNSEAELGDACAGSLLAHQVRCDAPSLSEYEPARLVFPSPTFGKGRKPYLVLRMRHDCKNCGGSVHVTIVRVVP